jgi:hypothetical protein
LLTSKAERPSSACSRLYSTRAAGPLEQGDRQRDDDEFDAALLGWSLDEEARSTAPARRGIAGGGDLAAVAVVSRATAEMSWSLSTASTTVFTSQAYLIRTRGHFGHFL